MTILFRPDPAVLAMQLAVIGDFNRDVVKNRLLHLPPN